jgi:hypothetical protein
VKCLELEEYSDEKLEELIEGLAINIKKATRDLDVYFNTFVKALVEYKRRNEVEEE